jgi:Cof subfamily protein (haloacid dehalogenase superfamily)
MTTDIRRRADFLDVDGTIMKDGRHIPASAIDAIRSARARGHLMFLSTGRGMKELRGPVLDIGFDGAVTGGGGFASIGDEIVVARLLTTEAVAHLEETFAAHGVHWFFQTYDRMFASPALPALMQHYVERDRALHAEKARAAGLDPDEAEFFSVGMKVFDDADRFVAAEVAKAVILSDDADAVAAATAELDGAFAVVSGTIPLPVGNSSEIAPVGVNKGAAILELLAHVGVDPADAIGIGDNWNDAEMFEVCGTSVAMGNAVPGVRELADQVTTPIDEDGIRNAFLRNGLIDA